MTIRPLSRSAAPGIPIAADVFTGHRVTVRYVESAGKKEAESVMVRELAKEKPAATSGTAKKQPTGTSGESWIARVR